MINPYQVTPHDPKDQEQAKLLQQVINDVLNTPEGRAVQDAIRECESDIILFDRVSQKNLAALEAAQQALYSRLKSVVPVSDQTVRR